MLRQKTNTGNDHKAGLESDILPPREQWFARAGAAL
jgi:hypothetical protein